jgi:hypothetical protein
MQSRVSQAPIIPLLKDAQEAKKRLDDFVKHIVNGINGVEPKFAPLKSVERAMATVYEKYDCLLDMLTDLARGTIEVFRDSVWCLGSRG